MLWESEAGAARVRVDPEAGGRVASLCVEDLELLLPKGADPLRWGLYPMAPFAGRVRRGRFRFAGIERSLATNLPPHAIHGTVFARPWCDDGGGRFSIDLGAGWPFAGRALQEVSLTPDALSLRLEVHSDGEPFPASLGWHPWFPRRLARGEDVALRIPARRMYVRDAEGIPSGASVAPPPGPWDDCFTGFTAPPEVHWPGALRLRIESSADHFVVYDEPEHAVCVEPQTGPPDALNGAPFIVEPGRPLVATMRLSWCIE